MDRQYVSMDIAHSALRVYLDALWHRDRCVSAGALRVMFAALVHCLASHVDVETVRLFSHYC